MPADVLNGYLAGGNDYLKKPFDLEELIIRIKVLLNQNRLYESDQTLSIVNIGKYANQTILVLYKFRKSTGKVQEKRRAALPLLYPLLTPSVPLLYPNGKAGVQTGCSGSKGARYLSYTFPVVTIYSYKTWTNAFQALMQ